MNLIDKIHTEDKEKARLNSLDKSNIEKCRRFWEIEYQIFKNPSKKKSKKKNAIFKSTIPQILVVGQAEKCP